MGPLIHKKSVVWLKKVNEFSSSPTVTPGTPDINPHAIPRQPPALQPLCRTSHFLHWNKMLPVSIMNLFFLHKERANVNNIYTNVLCRNKGCCGAVIDASVSTQCTLISPHVCWPGSHHRSECSHFKNPLTKHCSEAGHLLYWLH